MLLSVTIPKSFRLWDSYRFLIIVRDDLDYYKGETRKTLSIHSSESFYLSPILILLLNMVALTGDNQYSLVCVSSLVYGTDYGEPFSLILLRYKLLFYFIARCS